MVQAPPRWAVSNGSGAVDADLVAVVPREPVIGAERQEPERVLVERVDVGVGKAVGEAEMAEADGVAERPFPRAVLARLDRLARALARLGVRRADARERGGE